MRIAWVMLLLGAAFATVGGEAGAVACDALQDIVLREAGREIDNLKDSQKPDFLYGLALAQARHGDRAGAAKSLASAVELVKDDVPEDEESRTIASMSLGGLAKAQAEVGDLAGALRTVDLLPSETNSHVLSEISSVQAEAGDFQGALATARRIGTRDEFARSMASYALVEIARYQAERGDFAAAFQTVETIRSMIPKTPAEFEPAIANRNFALMAIADVQARRGRSNDALKTLDGVSDPRVKVLDLCEVALVQAKRGDERVAAATLHRALAIAERLDDEFRTWGIRKTATIQADVGDIDAALGAIPKVMKAPEKGLLLLHVSAAQAKSGEREAAAKSFRDGMALLKTADLSEYGSAVEAAAVRHARTGDFWRAIEIVDAMREYRASVLRSISAEAARQGKTAEALRIAESIADDPYFRADAFREIAIVQAKTEKSAARATFAQAFDAAKGIAIGAGSDVLSLSALGEAQAKAGFGDEAARSFEEARARAAKYPDKSYGAGLVQDVSRTQAAVGDAERALAAARAQRSPIVKARALLGVAEGLVKHEE